MNAQSPTSPRLPSQNRGRGPTFCTDIRYVGNTHHPHSFEGMLLRGEGGEVLPSVDITSLVLATKLMNFLGDDPYGGESACDVFWNGMRRQRQRMEEQGMVVDPEYHEGLERDWDDFQFYHRSWAMSEGLGLLCIAPCPSRVWREDSLRKKHRMHNSFTVLRVACDGSAVDPLLSFHLVGKYPGHQAYNVHSLSFLGTVSSEVVVVGCLDKCVYEPGNHGNVHDGWVQVIDVATGACMDDTFPTFLTRPTTVLPTPVNVVGGRTGNVIAVVTRPLSARVRRTSEVKESIHFLSRSPGSRDWSLLSSVHSVWTCDATIRFCDDDTRAVLLTRPLDGDRLAKDLVIVDVATGAPLRSVGNCSELLVLEDGIPLVLYGTYIVLDSCFINTYKRTHVVDSFGKRPDLVIPRSATSTITPNMVLPGGGGLASLTCVFTRTEHVRQGDPDVHVHDDDDDDNDPCARIVLQTVWLNPMKGVRGAWMSAVARAARARFEAWRQASARAQVKANVKANNNTEVVWKRPRS
jgi:hypothetical protein